jgi:cation transport ATPase
MTSPRVATLGYGEHLLAKLASIDPDDDERSTLRGALCVASIAAPIVLFGALVSQAPSASAGARDALRIAALAAAIPLYAALGGPLVAWAHRALRGGDHRALLDVAVVVLAIVALASSLPAVLAGRGEVWFDLGAVALVVLTAGRLGEARIRRTLLSSSAVPLLAVAVAALTAVATRAG